ncbi:MAG: carotenoid biosynthesis protein [Candidatus Hodarchaeales archaeon]
MSFELVFSSMAALGTCFLIIHSWKTRTHDFVVLYFVFGFIFGIVRENLLQILIGGGLIPSLYSYSSEFIRILYAPIVVGLGWAFAFYNGLHYSETLYKNDNIWFKSLISAFVVMLISIPIEMTAVALNWWEWNIPNMPLILNMPVMVPFGWASAAFLFNSTILILQKKKLSNQWMKHIIFLLLILPLILLHFIIVVIIRNFFVAIGLLLGL